MGAGKAEPSGTERGGTEQGGTEQGGTEQGGAEPRRAEQGGAKLGGAKLGGVAGSPPRRLGGWQVLFRANDAGARRDVASDPTHDGARGCGGIAPSRASTYATRFGRAS
ncbi:hypothetical protein GCM10020358_83630 [Amorphoplanes nipponensis]|uniref:Uncharacterized protein n=1 Tax=Actinoplanes nipponensis TaxID=135950 RepID=A0A919MSB1_9ACTN|nr:hypothetical protein Ani05nite_14340 [Actinoplanes nipponensis]